MRPTMAFSIFVRGLNFFAGPDENEHQAKEADGGEEIEDVAHSDTLVVVMFEKLVNGEDDQEGLGG